jgi:uncharacterized protein (DUF427 family)
VGESVWDYPRPPAVVPCEKSVRVELGGTPVAASVRALRVLETASPPTIYIPREDFADGVLERVPGGTACEWKGQAAYSDVVAGGRRAKRAAWDYPDPRPAFAELRDHVSLYPARVECFLGEERVRPQAGGFYGGWITDAIEGPFKGEPGTGHW